MSLKIALGCDHGGFATKEKIKEYLKGLSYEIKDVGCFDEGSVDYPHYGIEVGELVAQQICDYGIVICGTGIGISIACNKVEGVRCSLVHDVEMARLTRLHNNSNVLALSGRFLDANKAIEIVKAYLESSYEGGRHQKRLDIISNYERNKKHER